MGHLNSRNVMPPTPAQPNVAIAGGGLAGLAVACALSESGFRVTLFEKRPFLGGRASSYEHPGTGEVVDNCQHVSMACCTNLADFYLDERHGSIAIFCQHPRNGPMEMLIEDDAVVFVERSFLVANLI